MMEYVMRVYVQHDLAGLSCFDLFYIMIIWISWSLAWGVCVRVGDVGEVLSVRFVSTCEPLPPIT